MHLTKHKATLFFIFLSGAASFLNYIMYPFIARILEPQVFTEVTVALALFSQISSFSLSVVAITIGLSKDSDKKESKDLIEKLQTVLIHLLLIITLLFVAGLPLYIKQINIQPSLLIPVAGMLLFSVYISVISGYLNGKQKLIKLGFMLIFVAFMQLLFSVLGALFTQSGVYTLYSILIASIVSVTVITLVYRSENLPSVSSFFNHGFTIYKSKDVRSIVRYTILSSISVLVLNILLILDLLIINSRALDAEAYAGIYIISRVVFFAGMLLVWPVLGRIDIKKPRSNVSLMIRLTTLFVIIGFASVGIMLIFGKQVNQVILGNVTYNANINTITALAIIYKVLYLFVTTLVLFLIVLRSYWAIIIPVVSALGIGLSQILIKPVTAIEVLQTLIVSSIGVLAICGICFALIKRVSTKTTTPA